MPFALGLALWASASAGDAAALTADSVKVYTSTRGEVVVVVMLQPATDGKAVIRVTGTSSPLDGMALLYKHSMERDRDFFSTSWHGRNFSFVLGDHRHGEHWELYVPGDLNHARRITYDEKRTQTQQAAEILALYDRQLRDGSLQKLATFNRAEEQAAIDKTLRESASEAEAACGMKLPTRIAWSGIKEDDIKSYSIASYCSSPLSAMAAMCKQSKVASAFFAEKVKEVDCTVAPPLKLALTAGKLEWNIDFQGSNLDEFARKNLGSLEVSAPSSRAAGDAAPWGDAHTLDQLVLLGQAGVCTDGKNHFVVSAAHNANEDYLFYGDGKQLTRVELTEALGRGIFFEPRYVEPSYNASFRGLDVRLHSAVEFDADKQTCSVRCGKRRTELKVLSGPAANELLTKAKFLPPRKQYVAHVLVRDDRGNYYYVDKGSTPETAQQFRLFLGPKGAMKLQKMTNVVSDSQGEIFSTKTGDLRLVVGPQGNKSYWVKGQQRVELLAVPVEENWNMIWTELGVYTGEKRATPCDDL